MDPGNGVDNPGGQAPHEITAEEAAEELLKRRYGRASLLGFTEYTHPCWKTGNHHRLICEYLEKVERGEIDRLMIFAPPRHSKSELASRRFPAWYLGRHPDHQIITASYGEELAADIGADVRDILHDQYYRNLFPATTLRVDTTAAGRWRTDQGGIYIAAGVGGAITGRGANLLIIDDPIKNREAADSQRMRDVAWKWFLGVAMTRLMPGGRVIIMMTRWHEDDLAARALQTDNWKVLDLPAVQYERTEHETALWPEWFPIDVLRRTRETLTRGGRLREWKAQYQQKPTAEEGTYMRRDWFKSRFNGKAPENCRIYIASDFAVTPEGEGRDPDWTEHGVFAAAPDDKLYVVDWWSGQASPDVWISSLIELVKRWKPSCWFGEAGVIRRAVHPLLERLCHERRCYFRQEWVPSSKDKAIRGRSFQGWASMGRVVFPERSEWAERVIDQCIAFPTDTHDDKFDVLSLICLAIDEARSGIVRIGADSRKKKVDGYAEVVPISSAEWKVV